VSTFAAIELLRRALSAHQRAMDVSGHNVANANTPGFTRQEVVLSSVPPAAGSSRFRTTLLVGGGVQVSGVRQARNEFLDRQLREARQAHAEAQARLDYLAQVEAALPEPSDSGLGELLARFWNAWQELSLSPESGAARTALVQQASVLVDALRQTYNRVEELRQHTDAVAAGHVRELNALAAEVAALNVDVARLEVSGQRALDLRDRREQLLARLHQLADVSSVETDTGEVLVFLQGRELVGPAGRTTAVQIQAPVPGGVHTFQWPDGTPLQVRRGELAAVLQARDVDAPDLASRLDALAVNLRDAVNALHTMGYDLSGSPGEPFFVGSGAANLQVNPTVRADPSRVAAADAPGEPGNGAQALAIAQLRGLPAVDGAYQALVAEVGVRAREARRQVELRALLTDQLQLRREATSGVSLDEEMANMLRSQHAYDAAARMVRTVDEMVRTLLDMVGR
jgi:flagellar hook-associated protein 1 FlgK